MFISPKGDNGFDLLWAFSFAIMNDLAFGIGFWLTREDSLFYSIQVIGQLANLVFQFCKGLSMVIQKTSSGLLKLINTLGHKFHGLFQRIYSLGQWVRVEGWLLET